MIEHSSYVTPSEAAVLADVALRDVHRVIDERIIPAPFYTLQDGRRLRLSACPLVQFYFHTAGALTSEERMLVIDKVSSGAAAADLDRPFSREDEEWNAGSASWNVRDRFLTVDLADFIAATHRRWRRLQAARRRVVQDPDILGGTPVLRGTRVPVHDVSASVTAGVPPERLRQAYGLDDEAIELAHLYARAVPHRGRPRTSEARANGSELVASRRVARPRRA